MEDSKIEKFLEDLEKQVRKNNLHNLKCFHLNLNGCSQISDDLVMKISHSVKGIFKNLESLTLKFSCCKNLTNKALDHLIALAGSVQYSNLKHVLFDFHGCEMITQDHRTRMRNRLHITELEIL